MSRIQFVLALLLITASSTIGQDNGNIVIEVSGIRNVKGQIGVLLFNDRSGYPGDFNRALKSEFHPVTGEITAIRIKDVPYGDYVVTVMHDVNGNGKLDKTLLSMPKEAYGISNNPAPRILGPPAYDAGQFALSQEERIVQIALRQP